MLPPGVHDRAGWAVDTYAAFASQGIEPSSSNLCATLAIAGQESGFSVDPPVPGLPAIARAEIDRRAHEHGIPILLVHGALLLRSPDGRTYDQRVAAVRTEQDMSRIYEDFLSTVPLGRKLFADDNPVRTAGPMQVSVTFAEQYAKSHPYPYRIDGSIRHEVFTRRGGIYFGVAHLLGHPVSYPQMIYRFADYNAGFYASRNAAFQQAVSRVSGIPLELDGDLVRYDAPRGQTSATEVAVLSLSRTLGSSPGQIHRTLEQGETREFEESALYRDVFAQADAMEHRALPRAMLPRIDLHSPKISRPFSTEAFARRVDQRYRQCLARAGG